MTVNAGVCTIDPAYPGYYKVAWSVLVTDSLVQQFGELTFIAQDANPLASMVVTPNAWRFPAGVLIDWDSLSFSGPLYAAVINTSLGSAQKIIDTYTDGTIVYDPLNPDVPLPLSPRTGVSALPVEEVVSMLAQMGTSTTMSGFAYIPTSTAGEGCIGGGPGGGGGGGGDPDPPAPPRKVSIQVSWVRFYNAYAVMPPGSNTLPPQTGGPTPV